MNNLPLVVKRKIARYNPEDVLFPKTDIGLDPVKWVQLVVLPRIKKDKNGVYQFPDAIKDLQNYSTLHSWYKHFRQPGKVYPILRIGRDSKYDGPSSREEADELHWTFILDHIMFDKIRGEYFVENLPWKIMQNCSFRLSHFFYGFSLEPDSRYYDFNLFHAKCMMDEVSKVQDRITRILLLIDPNPPKKISLIYDPEIDPLVLWGEDENDFTKARYPNYEYTRDCLSVQIGDNFYKLKWGSDEVNLDKLQKLLSE